MVDLKANGVWFRQGDWRVLLIVESSQRNGWIDSGLWFIQTRKIVLIKQCMYGGKPAVDSAVIGRVSGATHSNDIAGLIEQATARSAFNGFAAALDRGCTDVSIDCGDFHMSHRWVGAVIAADGRSPLTCYWHGFSTGDVCGWEHLSGDDSDEGHIGLVVLCQYITTEPRPFGSSKEFDRRLGLA